MKIKAFTEATGIDEEYYYLLQKLKEDDDRAKLRALVYSPSKVSYATNGDYIRTQLGVISGIAHCLAFDYHHNRSLDYTRSFAEIIRNLEELKHSGSDLKQLWVTLGAKDLSTLEKIKESSNDAIGVIKTTLDSVTSSASVEELKLNLMKERNFSGLKFMYVNKLNALLGPNKDDVRGMLSLYSKLLPASYLDLLYMDYCAKAMQGEEVPNLLKMGVPINEANVRENIITASLSMLKGILGSQRMDFNSFSLDKQQASPLMVEPLVSYSTEWLEDELSYVHQRWLDLCYSDCETVAFLDVSNMDRNAFSVKKIKSLIKQIGKETTLGCYLIDTRGYWLDMLNRDNFVNLYIRNGNKVTDNTFLKRDKKPLYMWRSVYKYMENANIHYLDKSFKLASTINKHILRPNTCKHYKGQPIRYRKISAADVKIFSGQQLIKMNELRSTNRRQEDGKNSFSMSLV